MVVSVQPQNSCLKLKQNNIKRINSTSLEPTRGEILQLAWKTLGSYQKLCIVALSTVLTLL